MSAVRAEIDKLRSAYEAAVATGRIEAMLPLLAEGAVMVHPGAPDWKAMEAAACGGPFPPDARIVICPIEVVVLSDDWAYEFGSSTTSYTPPDAKEVTQLRATYLILFRKTADGWKVFREVASSSPPPDGWPTG